MKIRIAVVIVLGLALALGFAATAQAQCSGDDTPNHGQPGSNVTFCMGPFVWAYTVFFDGIVVASGSGFDEAERFSVSYTVPVTATVGNHEVIISYDGHAHGYGFYVFTVDAATLPVQSEAYPAGPTTASVLPSTGLFLLPAGGIVVGGMGLLMARKRQR